MRRRPLADWEFALAADLLGSGIHRWRFHYRFTRPLPHLQRQLRLAEKWAARPGRVSRLIARVRLVRCGVLSARLGAEIPANVAGPGFSIAHAPGIVINRSARIGRNCRIHQNVTIGDSRGGSPWIGDNVWIGAGAVLIGPITVGDDAVIAANAVVTKDVPSGVTVGGIPAQMISRKDSSRLIIDNCALVALGPGAPMPEREPRAHLAVLTH
jgi:serine O-acetyltransferase